MCALFKAAIIIFNANEELCIFFFLSFFFFFISNLSFSWNSLQFLQVVFTLYTLLTIIYYIYIFIDFWIFKRKIGENLFRIRVDNFLCHGIIFVQKFGKFNINSFFHFFIIDHNFIFVKYTNISIFRFFDITKNIYCNEYLDIFRDEFSLYLSNIVSYF